MTRRLLLALAIAFVLGVLTSFGQTVLPYDLAPLANSAGSWCAVAFLLALLQRRPAAAALTAGLALVALVAGYYVVSQLRGFGVSLTHVGFWVVAGFTVGPALGLAAAWLGRSGPPRWYAVVALPVVLVLEGLNALRTVADTTSPAYWWGQVVVGVLLVPVLARLGPVFAEREGPGSVVGNT